MHKKVLARPGRSLMIKIEDCQKIELKVGTVLEAEDVEGSEKLIKLQVDLGEGEPRQIFAQAKEISSLKH